MSVILMNFGKEEGIQTFRANGSKEELENMLEDIKEEGSSFAEDPQIEYVRLGEYSVLFKLKVEPVEIGAASNSVERS